MPRKRHSPEQILGKLREVEVALAKGQTVAGAVRQIAVTEQTYYRWRNEYGGLSIDQARRLKQLEQENARLKRAVADLTLDKLILKEAAEGNFNALHAAASVLITSGANSTFMSAEPADCWDSQGLLSVYGRRFLMTMSSLLGTSSAWQPGTAGTGTAGSRHCSGMLDGA